MTAGCGPARLPDATSASPSPAAASASTGGGVVTVPASSHVTGVYPARCRAVDGGRRPDPSCTPGAVQATVTQATIRSTICRHGWTATVRAPETETGKVKKAAMLAYGDPAGTSSTTELDHFLPLELGGANDVRNLWPEPSDEPGRGVQNSKDQVEDHLNAAVCRGQVGLVAAQQAIAADWTTAERTVGLVR
nr:hypothetical protein [Actinomycetospora corticicola]